MYQEFSPTTMNFTKKSWPSTLMLCFKGNNVALTYGLFSWIWFNSLFYFENKDLFIRYDYFYCGLFIKHSAFRK